MTQHGRAIGCLLAVAAGWVAGSLTTSQDPPAGTADSPPRAKPDMPTSEPGVLGALQRSLGSLSVSIQGDHNSLEASERLLQNDAAETEKDDALIAKLRAGVAQIRASGEGPTRIAALKAAGGLKPNQSGDEHMALFAYWMQEDPVAAMAHFHRRGTDRGTYGPFLLFAEDAELAGNLALESVNDTARQALVEALVRRRSSDLAARLHDMAEWSLASPDASRKDAEERIALRLAQNAPLSERFAILEQTTGWQPGRLDLFASRFANRLAPRDRLEVLQRAAATGNLPERWSRTRAKLSSTLLAATWLPLEERIAQAVEHGLHGTENADDPAVVARHTEQATRNAARHEVYALTASHVASLEFAAGDRSAEDVLALGLAHKPDLATLPEAILRERLFIRLAATDAARALPLVEGTLNDQAFEAAVTEAAGNIAYHNKDLEGALGFLDLVGDPAAGPSDARQEFANQAIHALHDELSPILVAEFLEGRTSTLSRDYLAAAWAAHLNESGGDPGLTRRFERLIQSEPARQFYENGEMRTP